MKLSFSRILTFSFFILYSLFFIPSPTSAQTTCCNDNCACACWGGGTDKNWYCQTCWNGGGVGYFDVTTNSCQFGTSLEYQAPKNYTPSCTSTNQLSNLSSPCCPGLTQCSDDYCRTSCTSTKNYCFDANNYCQTKASTSCNSRLGLFDDINTCWDNISTNSSPCYTIIPGNICQSSKPQYCYFARSFASQPECLRYFETQSQSQDTRLFNGASCSSNQDCQSSYCSPQSNICTPEPTNCFDSDTNPPCQTTSAKNCSPNNLYSTEAACRFALTQSQLVDCYTPEANCNPNQTTKASKCDPANNLFSDQTSCQESSSQNTTCLDLNLGCLAASRYESCDSDGLFLPDQLDLCLNTWNTLYGRLDENGNCLNSGYICTSPTTQAQCPTLNQPPQNTNSCSPLSCDPNSGYCTCWLPLDDGCVYTSGEICELGYTTKSECVEVRESSLKNLDLQNTLNSLSCDDPSLYFCDDNAAARSCIDGYWTLDSTKDSLCCPQPSDTRCIDIGDSSFIQTCSEAHNWQITSQTAACGKASTQAAQGINNVLKVVSKPFKSTGDNPGKLAFITRFYNKITGHKDFDTFQETPPPEEVEETKQLGRFIETSNQELSTCEELSPGYCDAVAEVNLQLFQLQTTSYQDRCLSDELSNQTCQSVLNQLASSISHLLQIVPQPKPLPWWRRLQLALPFI